MWDSLISFASSVGEGIADAASTIGDYASDIGEWASENSGLIKAGTSIAGALIGADANADAAERVARANREATAAQIAGNDRAGQRFETLRQDTQPGMSYLRGVVTAPPGTLTPFQAQQMDEARRTTTNRLATSGLRGSGRATVAAFRGVESDLRNRFVEANRNRADTAAGTLASGYTGATNQMAGLDRANGQAAATGISNTGLTQAGSTLATGTLLGSALGDIGSAIASSNKARASRYGGNDEDEDG
jgi:hypothetical protein